MAMLVIYFAIMVSYPLITCLFFSIFLFLAICLWKIFTKAGEQGWAAIVPIYNKYILVKIARLPVYYFVALYIPFLLLVIKSSIPNAISEAVNIAVLCLYCFIMYNLCKQFGKGIGYTLGMVFLPFIRE